MQSRVLVLAALAILIAWGLKRHYADAGVEDLSWMLTPTTGLVSVMTGTSFTWQAGEGYFSRSHLFLIEKSCARINFMIAAFGMLTIALWRRGGQSASVAWMLGVSLLASYAAAVVANATRIAIAMWLIDHPPPIAGLRAADVHRIEGVMVYFGALVLLHELVRLDRRAFSRIALPLTAYYGVTLGLPLSTGAARSGTPFLQHALVVVVVPLIAIMVWWVLGSSIARRRSLFSNSLRNRTVSGC